MLIAGTILVLDEVSVPFGLTYGLILTVVSLIGTGTFTFWLDRDRIISGASPSARWPIPQSMPSVDVPQLPETDPSQAAVGAGGD